MNKRFRKRRKRACRLGRQKTEELRACRRLFEPWVGWRSAAYAEATLKAQAAWEAILAPNWGVDARPD